MEDYSNPDNNIEVVLYPTSLSNFRVRFFISRLANLFPGTHIEMRNKDSKVVKLGIGYLSGLQELEEFGSCDGEAINTIVAGPEAHIAVEALHEAFSAMTANEMRMIHYKYLKRAWLKGQEDDENLRTFNEICVKTRMLADTEGIHMRPAMMLVNQSNKFESLILVGCRDDPILANGKSIMEMSFLCLTYGTECEIRTFGPDAIPAAEQLERMLREDLWRE